MKKKLTALLTAVVLAFSLAACGGSADPTPAPATAAPTEAPTVAPATVAPATETPATEAPAAETPAEEPDPAAIAANEDNPEVLDIEVPDYITDNFPGANLGGVTIKVTNMQNPETAPEAEKEMWLERQAYVENKFNIKLQFDALDGVEWNNIATDVIASVAAGDPIVHFWDASKTYFLPDAVAGNAVVDQTGIITGYFPKEYYEVAGSWLGVTYGFAPDPASGWQMLGFNRDLLNQIGMSDMPDQMFRRGEWTLEHFYDYLVELNTKLPEGVAPFAAHALDFARGAVYANGGFIKDPVTNAPRYLEDAFIEPMQLLQRLVQEGLILPPVYRTEEETEWPGGLYSWSAIGDMQQMFADGQIAMTPHDEWNSERVGAQFNFGLVPYPWGSNTQYDGDWRNLKTTSNYMSVLKDAGSMVMVSGTEQFCTTEQMINIYFSYRWDKAEYLVENIARVARGEGVVSSVTGTLRNFSTMDDVELYDWYTLNPTWEPMDTTSYSPQAHYAIYNTAGSGSDIRAAFEAIVGEDIWAMVEGGVMKVEDVPENYKAQYEEYGEWLAEQPVEEEAAE